MRQVLHEDQVFSHLFAKLQDFVNRNHLSHSVSLANEQRGIQITLRDVVLFNTGQDAILPAAQQILQGLVPFLHRVPNNSPAHRQMNRRVNIVILRSSISALTGPQGSTGPGAGFPPVTQPLGPNPHTLISHNETVHSTVRPLGKSLFGEGSAPSGKTP
ncbi:MAG: hypothetical protein ACYCVB_17775 [Bacilli bacterium]